MIINPPPVSKAKLTLLRKLRRKKYRKEKGLFIVEGGRAVEQVIENRVVAAENLFFDAARQLWTLDDWQIKSTQVESFTIDQADFMEVSDTDTPQGVLALCRMPPESTVQDLAKGQGILIATDGIRDPGNLGTMIRTASWFGVEGMLAGKGTVDLFHPKVVRSTAGATGSIPYLNADLETDLPLLEQAGWKVVLLDAGPGSQDLQTLKKFKRIILVVGNEANGINQELLASARIRGCIPSPVAEPMVESLNASVALSVALYSFTQ